MNHGQVHEKKVPDDNAMNCKVPVEVHDMTTTGRTLTADALISTPTKEGSFLEKMLSSPATIFPVYSSSYVRKM